ncbi:MAG: DUF6414 family protein [Solirubrobacterales bacterium]
MEEAFSFLREHWLAVLVALAVGGVAGFFLGSLAFPSVFKGNSGPTEYPLGDPAEFLYLDTATVDNYLAQLEGGSFSDETQRTKIVEAIKGSVHVGAVAEGDASEEEEQEVERHVTPTAASNFFILKTALEEGKTKDPEPQDITDTAQQHILTEFNVKAGPKALKPGELVYFRTENLRPPTYIAPFLAFRGLKALSEMFSASGSSDSLKSALAKRKPVRRFEKEVGKNPRVVLTLRQRPARWNAPRYLLPISPTFLSEEGSLVAGGGGTLVVVGKVLRIFERKHSPRYVDVSSLRTWTEPLRHVPGALLCLTDKRCARWERKHHLPETTSSGREVRWARRHAVRLLEREATIPGSGAIILPVAIYK